MEESEEKDLLLDSSVNLDIKLKPDPLWFQLLSLTEMQLQRFPQSRKPAPAPSLLW